MIPEVRNSWLPGSGCAWMSLRAALDGSAPEDKLRLVLDMSYTATAPKLRKKKA